MLSRTDDLLHLESSWRQVCTPVPDFGAGVAKAKLWLADARAGVPGNTAEESRIKVLWINGTQTCKDSKPQ